MDFQGLSTDGQIAQRAPPARKAAVGLFVCAVIVLANGLAHPHVLQGLWRYDDPQILDFVIHQPIFESLYQPQVWRALGLPFYTPFHTLSYALDYRLFGAQPAGFYAHHFISSSLLVALIATVLLRGVPPLLQAACGVALVFSLPIYVMTEQLMLRQYLEGGVFAVLAYALFIARSPLARALSVVCYAGAILCKEIYIPLPLLLLALPPGMRSSRGRWLTLAGYAAVLAAYLAMRVYMLGGMGGYQARLLPSLAAFSQFWDASPRWVFGAGLGGLLGLAAGILLVTTGLHQRILKRWLTLAWAVAAVLPILPVIHSMPVDIGAAYFVPHRYVFAAFLDLFVGSAVTCAVMCKRPSGAPSGQLPGLAALLTGLAFVTLVTATVLPGKDRQCLMQLNHYSEQVYGEMAAGRFKLNAAPAELRDYFALMERHIANIQRHGDRFANLAASQVSPPPAHEPLLPACLGTR